MTYVSQSYILAALNLTWPTRQLGPRVDNLVDVPVERTTEFTSFYSKLPLFSSTPSWMIQASVIEGYFFLPYLKRIRLDVFPRWGMTEDKYFEFIPSSWTSPSRLNGASCSPQNLLDLMIISLLTYQVDKYMEVVVGKYFTDSIDNVRRAVDIALAKSQTYFNGATGSSDQTQESHEWNGVTAKSGDSKDAADLVSLDETPISLEEVQMTLGHFITRIMQNDTVKKASRYDQENLRGELRSFLFAHLVSVEENARLSKQNPSRTNITPFQSPSGTFFEWVRSTAASHSACRYSFVFLTCLVAQGNLECFPDAEEKYFAQDLNLHLATMSRMYNDYGSLARDRLETNLNGLNFPEFCGGNENCRTNDDDAKAHSQDALELELKSKLLRLAEYERDCFKKALNHLGEMLEKRVTKALTSFSNTAELYGQVYVVRAIASRMQQNG